MPEHVWEVLAAVQLSEGDDCVNIVWECETCGKSWGTFSTVTLPNEEAGECE